MSRGKRESIDGGIASAVTAMKATIKTRSIIVRLGGIMPKECVCLVAN